MSPETVKPKIGLLICTCSGSCPSMANIDFWALSERVRLELGDRMECMLLHPRLCEEDGERLMGHLLSDDMIYITSACAEKRQAKLLREGFNKAGVEMDANHWLPIVMAQEDTNSVYEKIRQVVETLNPTAKEGA